MAMSCFDMSILLRKWRFAVRVTALRSTMPVDARNPTGCWEKLVGSSSLVDFCVTEGSIQRAEIICRATKITANGDRRPDGR